MAGCDDRAAVTGRTDGRPVRDRSARRLPRIGVVLATAALLNSAAVGLGGTTALVYFVRHVRLDVMGAGIALTVSQLIGISCSIPMGFLIDRVGGRRVLLVAGAVHAATTLGYLIVRDVGAYVVVTLTTTIAYQTAATARDALVGWYVTGAERTAERARIHVLSNVGIASGSLAGAVTLQVDSVTGYRFVFVLTAALLAAGAGVTVLLPAAPAALGGSRPRSAVVLRDPAFLLFALGNGLLAVHYGLFEIALPLWVTEHTSAPRWLVGFLMMVNTAVVISLQIAASRLASDSHRAARVLRASGMLFLLGFWLLGLAGTRPVAVAVWLLILGTAIYSLGEICHAAAGWTLSYDLAKDRLHGQYQGLFNGLSNAGIALGPVVAGALILAHGVAGWVGVGAAMALTAGVVPFCLARPGGPTDRVAAPVRAHPAA